MGCPVLAVLTREEQQVVSLDQDSDDGPASCDSTLLPVVNRFVLEKDLD